MTASMSALSGHSVLDGHLSKVKDDFNVVMEGYKKRESEIFQNVRAFREFSREIEERNAKIRKYTDYLIQMDQEMQNERKKFLLSFEDQIRTLEEQRKAVLDDIQRLERAKSLLEIKKDENYEAQRHLSEEYESKVYESKDLELFSKSLDQETSEIEESRRNLSFENKKRELEEFEHMIEEISSQQRVLEAVMAQESKKIKEIREETTLYQSVYATGSSICENIQKYRDLEAEISNFSSQSSLLSSVVVSGSQFDSFLSSPEKTRTFNRMLQIENEHEMIRSQLTQINQEIDSYSNISILSNDDDSMEHLMNVLQDLEASIARKKSNSSSCDSNLNSFLASLEKQQKLTLALAQANEDINDIQSRISNQLRAAELLDAQTNQIINDLRSAHKIYRENDEISILESIISSRLKAIESRKESLNRKKSSLLTESDAGRLKKRIFPKQDRNSLLERKQLSQLETKALNRLLEGATSSLSAFNVKSGFSMLLEKWRQQLQSFEAEAEDIILWLQLISRPDA